MKFSIINESIEDIMKCSLGIAPYERVPSIMVCPKCQCEDINIRERHADTGMDELYGRCNSCGHSSGPSDFDINEDFHKATIIDKDKMLKSLNIDGGKLTKVGSGTFAHFYDVGNGKGIKVTSDSNDVNALIKSQALKLRNIPKVYGHTKDGVKHGYAVLIDYVKGDHMPYSTSELHGLIQGKNFSELSTAKIAILRSGDPIRDKVLKNHNRDTKEERSKLSSLFHTIDRLQNMVDIEIDDYDQNIIDNGKDYVIVDLGM